MQRKPSQTVDSDYVPHQICPHCRLILAQDLCVCGWRRPRPRSAKRQSDWLLKGVAVVLVASALAWLVFNVLLER